MTHKAWLDNEYKQWVDALKECTVDNFGVHPAVKRMLGDVDVYVFNKVILEPAVENGYINLWAIEHIGGNFKSIVYRMVYYAQKVLQQNPKRIVEIGGGVGQFYAVLRALGYTGEYAMYDLPEVMDFQIKYLAEVEKRTGLKCPLVGHDPYNSDHQDWFCVSFYALGEFTDEMKDWYITNVVSQCPHGFIVWNPHSGASDKITFKCKVEDEYPLTSPGNKLLTW